MSSIDQTVRALQQRVAALEAENTRLQEREPVARPSGQGTSRRQVLARGVGVLGAIAGGAILSKTDPAVASAHAASEVGVSARKQETLQIILTPITSRGQRWAQHEWALGAGFTGKHPPVVVANAADDYMEHDETEQCSCSVLVRGTAGKYTAILMVRGIGSRATAVTINAVALGN